MTADRVLKFIEENHLIEPGDRVLIGLSGGADSVCMTHILYTLRNRLKIELFAAHLNHGIRGEEADRDESFVRNYTEKMGIPFFVKHVDIPGDAKKLGISEELCGRNARYDFFETLAKQHGISKIATAHNKNDQAETILMNFIRGASIQGLCGIPVRRGNIIRPILDLTRTEILEYLHKQGQDFVTDSTNNEEDYTRNKIRLNLLPEIQKNFNPNFVESAVRNGQNIRQDKEFLEQIAEDAYRKCVTDGKADVQLLRHEHISIRRRILYKMLVEQIGASDVSAFYIEHMDELLTAGKTGNRIDLPRNTEAAIEYGRFTVRKKQSGPLDFAYRLTVGCTTEIPELGISVSLEKTDHAGKEVFTFPAGAEIILRNRRNGDVFYPEGMQGKKKLKDYFIDEKISREQRKKIGILTVDGEIACLVGKRRDRRFAFRDRGVRVVIHKKNSEEK